MEWSLRPRARARCCAAGLKKSSLPLGEKVVVRTHPMKDGRPAGAWIDGTRGNGTRARSARRSACGFPRHECYSASAREVSGSFDAVVASAPSCLEQRVGRSSAAVTAHSER